MPTGRRGFTLVEVLVSMVVLLGFLGMAATVLQVQGRTVTREAGRQRALHGARAVAATVERELRVAGTNLAAGQPLIVEGGPRSLVFNTDLVSPLVGDPFASYVNPNADPLAVSTWRAARALPLPASGRPYPESTYVEAAGVPGAAETIAFWVAPDSASGRSDEYILYRRVNSSDAEVLARGIVLGPRDTLFRYFRADSLGVLRQFPTASLPLLHRVPLHGSPSDTGPSARADSVRVVQLTITARSRDPKGGQSLRTSVVTVRILNSAVAARTTCGDAPFGVSPGAVAGTDPSGATVVRVAWSRATDDGGGENDVQRYVIYRRPAGGAAFDTPLASIPAGSATYSFTDSDVRAGQQWTYGVAAQDCTPSMSPIGTSSTVTIP